MEHAHPSYVPRVLCSNPRVEPINCISFISLYTLLPWQLGRSWCYFQNVETFKKNSNNKKLWKKILNLQEYSICWSGIFFIINLLLDKHVLYLCLGLESTKNHWLKLVKPDPKWDGFKTQNWNCKVLFEELDREPHSWFHLCETGIETRTRIHF